MASVTVDPSKVREFKNGNAFAKWLAKRHDRETELWIKIHKVSSGLPSISPKEAIDVALCWGWIDGIRKGFDDASYLQRFTPRGRKSNWSRINVANVERLVAEGRMTAHGLKHVEAAKSDGRWDRAYGRDMEVPRELQMALEADPEAARAFERLSAQDRFAMIYRTHAVKGEAARRKKVEGFMELLRGMAAQRA